MVRTRLAAVLLPYNIDLDQDGASILFKRFKIPFDTFSVDLLMNFTIDDHKSIHDLKPSINITNLTELELCAVILN